MLCAQQDFQGADERQEGIFWSNAVTQRAHCRVYLGLDKPDKASGEICHSSTTKEWRLRSIFSISPR